MSEHKHKPKNKDKQCNKSKSSRKCVISKPIKNLLDHISHMSDSKLPCMIAPPTPFGTFSVLYPGSQAILSYLDGLLSDAGPFLTPVNSTMPRTYVTWCSDVSHDVTPTQEYNFRAVSTYDPSLQSIFAQYGINFVMLRNINAVNYIFNRASYYTHFLGFTFGDVQTAIWNFLLGMGITNPTAPFDQDHVDYIIRDVSKFFYDRIDLTFANCNHCTLEKCKHVRTIPPIDKCMDGCKDKCMDKCRDKNISKFMHENFNIDIPTKCKRNYFPCGPNDYYGIFLIPLGTAPGPIAPMQTNQLLIFQVTPTQFPLPCTPANIDCPMLMPQPPSLVNLGPDLIA